MLNPTNISLIARRGISLLEVLMAMFVLAVGILSIFGLFTAGRELEARAAIKSDAIAYAGTVRNTVAEQWIAAWPDWLYSNGTGTFARVADMGVAPSDPRVALPVLIDPSGLSADAQQTDQFLQQPVSAQPVSAWGWSRMTPLTSGTVTHQPFARLTLPLVTSGTVPMTREGALASVADQDSVEYTLPANETDPPRNAFELGRRKRGSDLVPALFVAAAESASLGATALNAGVLVKRTLLIFHKPSTDMEAPASGGAGGQGWPAGCLELEVQQAQAGLLEASLTRDPQEKAVIRRSLRPGNWLLIVEQQPLTIAPNPPPPPPYWYRTRWVKMKSATENGSPLQWLLVLDEDKTTTTPARCYAFERLAHVVDDFDQINLP